LEEVPGVGTSVLHSLLKVTNKINHA